jgi:hypothetical protein
VSTAWPAGPIGAYAYTDKAQPPNRIADVPATWWRKIELRYPDGGLVVLAYDREPGNPAELPGLMLRLQILAGKGYFTVTVVYGDGSSEQAPAL